MAEHDEETTSLLHHYLSYHDNNKGSRHNNNNNNNDDTIPSSSENSKSGGPYNSKKPWILLAAIMGAALVMDSILLTHHQQQQSLSSPDSILQDENQDAAESYWQQRSSHWRFPVPRLGKKKKKKHGHKKSKKKKDKHKHKHEEETSSFVKNWHAPEPVQRCNWVMARFHERDQTIPPLDLKKRYLAQSQDPNVFYRATAHLFWPDFAIGEWGHNFTSGLLLKNDPDDRAASSDSSSDDAKIAKDSTAYLHVDGASLTKKDLWTWVTGDQHLSNFGAWQNRHKDIVFGVNDFDEAAIFDFQIDILRIAVSICSHAITNGLDEDEVDKAIRTLTDRYVKTIVNYVDNQDALLFELTPKTATGQLKDFLEKTQDKKSSKKQMVKFTHKNTTTGRRHFIKGPINVPHPDTSLAKVPPYMESQIQQAFTKTHYGASMMKLGWAVLPWDDDYFTVLDVAERVGSGIGSFGVDRYYVLLKGKDGLLQGDGEGTAVILDVKFQPKSAVSRILDEEDAAWYSRMFATEASRVVEAQRRLTSYTDPYTGWITLKNWDPNDKNTTYGQDQPFNVRQRSPWKDSPNLDDLTDPDDFYEFVSQIAISTATSHVRGSVAKPPGDFKNVIAEVLGPKHKVKEWGQVVAKSAKAYREQVLLDFDCFKQYVLDAYGPQDDKSSKPSKNMTEETSDDDDGN